MPGTRSARPAARDGGSAVSHGPDGWLWPRDYVAPTPPHAGCDCPPDLTDVREHRGRGDRPRGDGRHRPVPRHEFVPEEVRSSAYANRPLPIGHGQTISQPYIVALMTHLLGVESGARALEIGPAPGYQAAVLAEMGAQVHTIEIVKPLAEQATRRLVRLGYGGVRTRLGDGYYGWPEAAPFDAIIVTAAAAHVPPPLVEQIARAACWSFRWASSSRCRCCCSCASGERRGERAADPSGAFRAADRRALTAGLCLDLGSPRRSEFARCRPRALAIEHAGDGGCVDSDRAAAPRRRLLGGFIPAGESIDGRPAVIAGSDRTTRSTRTTCCGSARSDRRHSAFAGIH